jgi:hypothetical protein
MKLTRSISIVLAALCVSLTIAQAQDPLPSWNDAAPKKAIVEFVAKVTKEGSPDFVPPAETARCGASSRCISKCSSRWTA